MQSMVTIVNETIAYLKVTKTAEFQRIARRDKKAFLSDQLQRNREKQ